MKRRFLLLMMTALLSVGAWAENVWSSNEAVTPGGGSKHDVTFPTNLTTNDVIKVSVNITNQYYYGIQLCKINNGWVGDKLYQIYYEDAAQDKHNNPAISGNHTLEIPVTADIISEIETASGALTFYGYGYTMTSVDIDRYACGYTLLENANISYWGQALDCRLFLEYATTNDVIVVTGTKNEEYNGNVIIQNKDGGEGTVTYGSGDLGTKGSETPVVIPVTSDMITAASTGLYISGGTYHLTSAKLIKAPSAVSIGTTGYATFGYPAAVDLSGLSASQDAYTVTVSGTTATLTSVKGMKIPANTGIILKGSNGDAISLPLTTASTDEIGTNNLHVSDGTVTGDGTIYVLANKDSKVGFYKLENNDKVPAGKAYLQISNGVASARAFIGFGDNDGTTGIDDIERPTLNIEEDYYNLNGQRVAQPTKGLYIVNGKKVIIK